MRSADEEDAGAATVAVVVPARDAAATLPATLDALAVQTAWPAAVVVVDDGSADDTAAVARAMGALVVQHPINLGQGAALQTGIDFAMRRGAQYMVTFDADGQHVASEIGDLVAALQQSGADIACGSRFLGRTENLPKARRVLLKMATVFTAITSGLRMTDAHNGFRVLTRKAASEIRIRQNRMAHASEIINEIARHDLRFVEVPVTIRYSEYSIRKGQKLSNSFNILLDLLIKRLYR